MTNQQLREKKEAKGFKITANMGYNNGEQKIVSYTLTNKNGVRINTKTSLSKLLR